MYLILMITPKVRYSTRTAKHRKVNKIRYHRMFLNILTTVPRLPEQMEGSNIKIKIKRFQSLN